MNSNQIRWRDAKWWVLVAYLGVMVLAAGAALWPEWGFVLGVVALTGVNMAREYYRH